MLYLLRVMPHSYEKYVVSHIVERSKIDESEYYIFPVSIYFENYNDAVKYKKIVDESYKKCNLKIDKLKNQILKTQANYIKNFKENNFSNGTEQQLKKYLRIKKLKKLNK